MKDDNLTTDGMKRLIEILALVASITFFVAGTYFLADNTAKAVEIMRQKQDKYQEDISEIKSDIRVIKQILKEGN